MEGEVDVFCRETKNMTKNNKNKVLSGGEKKQILNKFCVKSRNILEVVCYSEPSNRKVITEKIQNNKNMIFFVALYENGNITLKATNGSSNNLKKLFKDKNKLLGIVCL